MRNFQVRLASAPDRPTVERLLIAAIRWARQHEGPQGPRVWEFAWSAYGELAEQDEREFFSLEDV